MNIRKLGLLAGGIAIVATSGAWAMDHKAEVELGKAEYLASCAACHGVDGKGGGPVADVMTTKPLDLTQISKKYGSFPSEDIYTVIDGRKMINPHGSRDMPVWGYRYLSDAIRRSNEVPHDVDVMKMVHGRITALSSYIESIQAE